MEQLSLESWLWRSRLAPEGDAEWTDQQAALHQRLSEQQSTSRHLRTELAEALHQEQAAQEAGLAVIGRCTGSRAGAA